jgi:ABC-type transport system substrate-binding protein
VTQRYSSFGRWAQLAEVIASQLREIGIQVKMEPQDSAVYIGRTLYQRDFEMTSFYNLISFHSPEFPLRYFTSSGISGEGNWFYYSDPDVDDMYERIAVTFDKEERREMVLDMQRLIISKNPCVMSLYAPWGFTALREYIKGRPPPDWGPARRYYLANRVWLDK